MPSPSEKLNRNMNRNYQGFAGLCLVFGIFWITAMASSAMVIAGNFVSGARRFRLWLVVSLMAIAAAYVASIIHVTYTNTVNGQVTGRFDSHWFSNVSFPLAVLALALTLWKKWKAPLTSVPPVIGRV